MTDIADLQEYDWYWARRIEADRGSDSGGQWQVVWFTDGFAWPNLAHMCHSDKREAVPANCFEWGPIIDESFDIP